jgi:hypothetical protein
MVQLNRSGNQRVTGQIVGRMTGGAGVRASTAGLTPEQRAQRDKETQASYETWRAQREARKAQRYDSRARRNNGL